MTTERDEYSVYNVKSTNSRQTYGIYYDETKARAGLDRANKEHPQIEWSIFRHTHITERFA